MDTSMTLNTPATRVEMVTIPQTELAGLRDQLAKLQKLNEMLSQNLVDANIEIEATVDEFRRSQDEIEAAKKEVERAKERAERSDQVKSAFLASMSHELRTPLNAIINFTRFVIDGDLGPVNESQKDILTDVNTSGKHLLGLINDVLDMSKIEAGSLKLFIEEGIQLRPLFNRVVSTARGLLHGKDVQLLVDIADELPTMRGDEQRLTQVFLNVVGNACKFTDKGEISVTAKVEGQNLVVKVRDTGPGIAPEETDLVFQPFKQTDQGIRKGGGTGLGMPISKSLVEAHGGRIWLESELNCGTTFYINLPLKAETGKSVQLLDLVSDTEVKEAKTI
jgi:signal transduction histidine kinase